MEAEPGEKVEVRIILWKKVDFPQHNPVGGHMVCISVTEQVLLSIPLSSLMLPVLLD